MDAIIHYFRMVNKMYKRGYKFELRVRKYLEDLGYTVFRIAGSKPIDLIALSRDKVYIIECKATKMKNTNIRRMAEKMVKYTKDTIAIPLLAYRDEDNKIVFFDLRSNAIINIPAANNLEKYTET